MWDIGGMIHKLFRKLFRKRKHEGIYPFADSLKPVFPSCRTPIQVLDFIRALMDVLDTGMTEVEILFVILDFNKPMPASVITSRIFHAHEEHVKSVLRKMTRHGLLHEEILSKAHREYTVPQHIQDEIKNLT